MLFRKRKTDLKKRAAFQKGLFRIRTLQTDSFYSVRKFLFSDYHNERYTFCEGLFCSMLPVFSK